MFRFLFRTIAVFCLALTVIFTVLDATKSISLSKVESTPLGTSWLQFAPESLEQFSNWVRATLPAFLSDTVFMHILTFPTLAVFAILSLFFYVLGYRNRRRKSIKIGR